METSELFTTVKGYVRQFRRRVPGLDSALVDLNAGRSSSAIWWLRSRMEFLKEQATNVADVERQIAEGTDPDDLPTSAYTSEDLVSERQQVASWIAPLLKRLTVLEAKQALIYVLPRAADVLGVEADDRALRAIDLLVEKDNPVKAISLLREWERSLASRCKQPVVDDEDIEDRVLIRGLLAILDPR